MVRSGRNFWWADLAIRFATVARGALAGLRNGHQIRPLLHRRHTRRSRARQSLFFVGTIFLKTNDEAEKAKREYDTNESLHNFPVVPYSLFLPVVGLAKTK